MVIAQNFFSTCFVFQVTPDFHASEETGARAPVARAVTLTLTKAATAGLSGFLHVSSRSV